MAEYMLVCIVTQLTRIVSFLVYAEPELLKWMIEGISRVMRKVNRITWMKKITHTYVLNRSRKMGEVEVQTSKKG